MLGLSFRNRSGVRASRFATLARLAEDAGFEHLIFTEWYNDVIAYLVAAASTTRSSHLWAGVANVGLRHPFLMASGATVADDVSGGRFVLGLGTGNEWHPGEKLDTRAARPLDLIREYVLVVRAALGSQSVTHNGPRFPVRGARLSFAAQRSNLPIYLAALGPRMSELAGEIADGVFVHMHAPEDLVAVRERIAAGCERASRDPSDITLAALLIVCIDDDHAAARASVRRAITSYLGYDSYRRHLLRLGYAAVLKQMGDPLGKGDLEQAAECVPNELIDRVAVCGSVEACKRRLEDFATAGADVTVLSPRPAEGADNNPLLWERMYEKIIHQFGRRNAGKLESHS